MTLGLGRRLPGNPLEIAQIRLVRRGADIPRR